MTTIAYKDGFIATDGRTCRGTYIVDDDTIKRFEHRGCYFWLSGRPHEYYAVLDDIIDRRMGDRDDFSAGGLVLIDGVLHGCGHTHGEGWRYPVAVSHTADGSGMEHALTAMDMGANAYEAVQMAAKRDTGTGGTIRVYDAKTGEEV